MADKVEVLLYSFTDCGFYSEEDLQTYRLNIYFAVWFGNVFPIKIGHDNQYFRSDCYLSLKIKQRRPLQ